MFEDLDIKKGVATTKTIHTIKEISISFTDEELESDKTYTLTKKQLFDLFAEVAEVEQTEQVVSPIQRG